MSVFDRLTPPATAKLFGTELVAENSSEGVIEFAFPPNETMLNPRGMVQGGIIAAMLDDTMAPALISLTATRRSGVTNRRTGMGAGTSR